MLVVAAMIPFGICALFARSDARRGVHLLLRRSLTVAAGLTLGLLTLILMAVSAMATQTTVVANWFAIIAAHATVFGTAMTFGSLGYFFSYRIFRSSIPHVPAGGNENMTRVDESGNPYQPPST